MKYPVLLVHGMGLNDNYKIKYWGRIPEHLETLGCDVYLSGQDSNASIETNTQHIAKKVDEVLAATGAKKLNIIAHSKGGLESRYLVSSCGYADKIASITTLCTPHNGSKTVDALMKFPDSLIRCGCFCFDVFYKVLGDKNPDTYKVINAFKTPNAQKFNDENPDQKGIYYQSYACVMKNSWSDVLFWLPSLVVNHFEGENDGLLPPDAVKWGEDFSIIRGEGRRGISHADAMDLRHRQFRCKTDAGIPDILSVYEEIARRLEELNF